MVLPLTSVEPVDSNTYFLGILLEKAISRDKRR